MSLTKTIQLLSRILDSETAAEPLIELGAPKPELPLCQPALSPIPPEKQGIPSAHIAAFLQTLADEPSLRMHSVLILRKGQLLCKAAFGAQDADLPRMTFSACKSITALAIGLLMDDGLLHPEDRLADLFPADCGPVSRQLMRDLTLEHLLSMRTGNLFNEAGSMTDSQWTRAFFASPALDHSRKFQYNSLNTYILAVLVTRLTGFSLSDFLRKRLFAPMGIWNFHWELSPEGIEKGGWGLYMTAEDLGKIGQLVMDRGCWEGKQLISADFIEKALSTHAIPPESCGDFNYGWQIWVGRKENTFLFNGMLGQNVLGFRDSGVILVSHGGNEELFQTGAYFRLAQAYFGGHFPESLRKNPAGERILRQTLRDIGCHPEKMPLPGDFDRFAGKRFAAADSRAVSVGLLPLTLQVVESCFTKGLRAVSIGGTRTAPVVLYEELDQLHTLICGIKKPVYQVLVCGGSSFRTAVQARFTRNEEDEPVLRIQIDFLETPCTRILKIILTRQGPVLKQEETPGAGFLSHTLPSLLQRPTVKPVLSAILGSAEQGYLRWKLEKSFTPMIKLAEE